ncbi:MAG: MFS transporter [Chloroflexi bacterium]|nr:MFS transporter [Chloroflexota bacterium]
MSAADAAIPPQNLEHLRRRTVWALVAGVALGSTGHIAAATVATIAAKHIAGSSAWSGAPGAAVVMGAAVGAVTLSQVMVRRGRRVGLVAGYGLGVVGAIVATAAVVGASLPLLLLGTFFIGFGNASNQLSRYTAADLVAPERHASAIGIVVWGATVGAVVGPNLAAPAGALAIGLGLPELSGAFLVPVAFVGAAALISFLMLRPDPDDLAHATSRRDSQDADQPMSVSLVSVLARPSVAVAIVALVAGQFVMVLIMTMTPLHMADHGHDLAAVGVVISGHTFGMYGLSPLSGSLTDRFGSVPVILAGLATVAAAAILAAVAPPTGGMILFASLFLLGYGWNLGYVAGSALLTTGLSLAERTRIQGLTDGLIWSSAAAASLGSGIVVAFASFATLGLLGAALVVVPFLHVMARRSAVVESRS